MKLSIAIALNMAFLISSFHLNLNVHSKGKHSAFTMSSTPRNRFSRLKSVVKRGFKLIPRPRRKAKQIIDNNDHNQNLRRNTRKNKVKQNYIDFSFDPTEFLLSFGTLGLFLAMFLQTDNNIEVKSEEENKDFDEYKFNTLNEEGVKSNKNTKFDQIPKKKEDEMDKNKLEIIDAEYYDQPFDENSPEMINLINSESAENDFMSGNSIVGQEGTNLINNENPIKIEVIEIDDENEEQDDDDFIGYSYSTVHSNLENRKKNSFESTTKTVNTEIKMREEINKNDEINSFSYSTSTTKTTSSFNRKENNKNMVDNREDYNENKGFNGKENKNDLVFTEKENNQIMGLTEQDNQEKNTYSTPNENQNKANEILEGEVYYPGDEFKNPEFVYKSPRRGGVVGTILSIFRMAFVTIWKRFTGRVIKTPNNSLFPGVKPLKNGRSSHRTRKNPKSRLRLFMSNDFENRDAPVMEDLFELDLKENRRTKVMKILKKSGNVFFSLFKTPKINDVLKVSKTNNNFNNNKKFNTKTKFEKSREKSRVSEKQKQDYLNSQEILNQQQMLVDKKCEKIKEELFLLINEASMRGFGALSRDRKAISNTVIQLINTSNSLKPDLSTNIPYQRANYYTKNPKMSKSNSKLYASSITKYSYDNEKNENHVNFDEVMENQPIEGSLSKIYGNWRLLYTSTLEILLLAASPLSELKTIGLTLGKDNTLKTSIFIAPRLRPIIPQRLINLYKQIDKNGNVQVDVQCDFTSTQLHEKERLSIIPTNIIINHQNERLKKMLVMVFKTLSTQLNGLQIFGIDLLNLLVDFLHNKEIPGKNMIPLNEFEKRRRFKSEGNLSGLPTKRENMDILYVDNDLMIGKNVLKSDEGEYFIFQRC